MLPIFEVWFNDSAQALAQRELWKTTYDERIKDGQIMAYSSDSQVPLSFRMIIDFCFFDHTERLAHIFKIFETNIIIQIWESDFFLRLFSDIVLINLVER